MGSFVRTRGAASPCFNEAAALLPRKMPTLASCPAWATACFNEAAALLPRKMLIPDENTTRPTSASMRPRHYCRGRSVGFAHARHRDPAGFNEAAALLPRKIMRKTLRVTKIFDGASMRPRHYCRGRYRTIYCKFKCELELQ